MNPGREWAPSSTLTSKGWISGEMHLGIGEEGINASVLNHLTEGAVNHGMLMGAMNLAAAWVLPILFACRDNGMAITAPSGPASAAPVSARGGPRAQPSPVCGAREHVAQTCGTV